MKTCTSLSTATYTTTSVVPTGSSNVFLTSRSVSTGHSVLTSPGLLSAQYPSRVPKPASPMPKAESSKSGRSKPMPSSTGTTWYLYSEAPYGTTIVGALDGAAAVPSDPTVDRTNMRVTGSKTRFTNRDLSFMGSSQHGFRRDDVRAGSRHLSAPATASSMPQSAPSHRAATPRRARRAVARRSTLPRHPPWFDHVHDPHCVGSGTAVDLHASVLPRERVDVLDRTGLGDLDHASPDRQVTVGVVGVEDREGDAGIAPHVLVLDASARRVDANVLAVEVEPDGGYLRTAVRHDGGEIGECFLRGNEIEELGRDGASGGDVLGRMATTRGCSLDTVMAEAGTSASEEAE